MMKRASDDMVDGCRDNYFSFIYSYTHVGEVAFLSFPQPNINPTPFAILGSGFGFFWNVSAGRHGSHLMNLYIGMARNKGKGGLDLSCVFLCNCRHTFFPGKDLLGFLFCGLGNKKVESFFPQSR